MKPSSRFISAAWLVLALPAAAEPRYQRSQHSYTIPAVTLIDQAGSPVRLDTLLKGPAPVLLQFVFTTCSTICPILSATFGAAQKDLGADVRLVSISIDPGNDTPARLSQFAARVHAGRSWTFLTGAQSNITEVQRAFDAEADNKMNHQPLTFLRAAPGRPWIRLDGLTSVAELLAEYRATVTGH